jgi:hypothetical protein
MTMFSFAKFGPTDYVIHYSNGRIKREGRGLTFFYWRPTSSIVAVPMSSFDLPFVFNDVTSDFQNVTIQGQLTFRISEPRKIAELLDFTVGSMNQFEKIGQRLINEAHTSTTTYVAQLPLREALRGADAIAKAIFAGLSSSASVQALGITPLSVAVVSVSTTPEMSRALEAEAREALQQEADMAIYARRNNAVAEERKIKESELKTEIAVEQQRKTLVDLRADNDRKDADTRAYANEVLLKAIAGVDWKTLLALSGSGADSRLVIANAFDELAKNAQKIGTLNVTPDLLQTLVRDQQA